MRPEQPSQAHDDAEPSAATLINGLKGALVGISDTYRLQSDATQQAHEELAETKIQLKQACKDRKSAQVRGRLARREATRAKKVAQNAKAKTAEAKRNEGLKQAELEETQTELEETQAELKKTRDKLELSEKKPASLERENERLAELNDAKAKARADLAAEKKAAGVSEGEASEHAPEPHIEMEKPSTEADEWQVLAGRLIPPRPPTSTLPPGLILSPVLGDADYHFAAVAMFVGISVQQVKIDVAQHLDNHKKRDRDAFLDDEKVGDVDRPVAEISKEERNKLEISAMQALYRRPIFVIHADRKPDYPPRGRYTREPIFLYFDDPHYGVFLPLPGVDPYEIEREIRVRVGNRELVAYPPARRLVDKQKEVDPQQEVDQQQEAGKTTEEIRDDHQAEFDDTFEQHLAKLGLERAVVQRGLLIPDFIFHDTLDELLENECAQLHTPAHSVASYDYGSMDDGDDADDDVEHGLQPALAQPPLSPASPLLVGRVRSASSEDLGAASPGQANPEDVSNLSEWQRLCVKHRCKLLVIECTATETAVVNSNPRLPRPPIAQQAEQMHFSHTWVKKAKERKLNRYPDAIIGKAEQVIKAEKDELRVLAVLKIGDTYYPLESNPLKASKTCCNFTKWAALFMFLSVAEGFGHGMLYLAQLTKSEDIHITETPDGDNLIPFIALAFVIGIPTMVHSYDKLTLLRQRYKFIRKEAFFPDAMLNKDRCFFVLWTIPASIIDGFLTGSAIYHLTGKTMWASVLIGIIASIQFVPMRGTALAREFNRPVWETDYHFLKQGLSDPGFNFRTLLTRRGLGVIAVNSMMLLGVSAITFLAADEVKELGSDIELKKHRYLLTFVISTLYLAYSLSLHGTRVKAVMYSALNRTVSLRQSCQKISISKIKCPALKCPTVSLSNATKLIAPLFILNSAFLDIVKVQVGFSELFNVHKDRHQEAWRFSYASASMFALMAFCTTGLPFIQRVYGSKKTIQVAPSSSHIKEVSTIKRGLSDFAKALFLALPIFGAELSGSSLSKKNRLIACSVSGLIFSLMYIYRVYSQHATLGVSLKLCHLSCRDKVKYECLIREKPPSSDDIHNNPHQVFIFGRKGHVHFQVRDPENSQRIIDIPLSGSLKGIKNIQAVFAEQARNKVEPDPLDLADLEEKVQAEITENIFSDSPHMWRSFLHGIVCASFFLGVLAIAEFSSPKEKSTLITNLIGVSAASLLAVLLLKNSVPHISDKPLTLDEPRCFTHVFAP